MYKKRSDLLESTKFVGLTIISFCKLLPGKFLLNDGNMHLRGSFSMPFIPSDQTFLLRKERASWLT